MSRVRVSQLAPPGPIVLLALLILGAAFFLAIPACGEEPGLLLVDLKSDLLPGAEVTSVDLELRVAGVTGTPVTVDTDVEAGADLLAGVRLAELAADTGTYELIVSLRDASAEVLLERRVVVEVRGSTGVTVLATRSCQGVVCDDATTCVAGQCVDPRCTPEAPETCLPEQCASDVDCATNECVTATCGQGACFASPDDALCSMDQTCSVDDGCVGEIPPVVIPPPPTGPPEDALVGVSLLGAGAKHVCAVAGDELRCWGDNGSGQLGDGTSFPSNQPGSDVGLRGVSSLQLGDDFSCATTGAGVSCWGDNSFGQIAQGPLAGSTAPLQVMAPVTIGDGLGVGSRHACAPEEGLCLSPGPCTHDLYCWGDNAAGQLGDGTISPRDAATRIDFSDTLYRFAGGRDFSCFDTFSGLYCWGSNGSGQLGLGDTTPRTTPTVVIPRAPFASGLRSIVAGGGHACALDAARALTCWGDNADGQIGDGTSGNIRPAAVPVTVGDGSGEVLSVALGSHHSCALLDDGTVWCWGANESGQLGDDTTTPRSTPVQVPLDEDAVEVVTGHAFSCARTISTFVFCWGANSSGELGDGSGSDSTSPVYVLDPDLGGSSG